MKLTELTEIVSASATTLTKAYDEITSKLNELNSKITSLEDLVANSADAPQDLVDAVNAVKIAAQSLDDVIPDAVVEPTPTE